MLSLCWLSPAPVPVSDHHCFKMRAKTNVITVVASRDLRLASPLADRQVRPEASPAHRFADRGPPTASPVGAMPARRSSVTPSISPSLLARCPVHREIFHVDSLLLNFSLRFTGCVNTYGMALSARGPGWHRHPSACE